MEYHSGGSLPLLGRPRYCPGANVNGGYLCETGHCCGETGCCTYYYELWWFWLLWTVLILFSCCCAYRHRRAKLRVQQQQRQRDISMLAYHGAGSYPSSLLDLSFLASLKLPSYEEVAAQPSTPPPPYSSVFTTPRYPQPPRTSDPHLLTQHSPLLHRPLSDDPSSLSSDNSSSCSCDSCCPSSPCSSSLSAPVTYETDTSHATTPSEATPLTIGVTIETIAAAASRLEVNEAHFVSERLTASEMSDEESVGAKEPIAMDSSDPNLIVSVAALTRSVSLLDLPYQPASSVTVISLCSPSPSSVGAAVPSIHAISMEDQANIAETSISGALTPKTSKSCNPTTPDNIELRRTFDRAALHSNPTSVPPPDVGKSLALTTVPVASPTPDPNPCLLPIPATSVLSQVPGPVSSDLTQRPIPTNLTLVHVSLPTNLIHGPDALLINFKQAQGPLPTALTQGTSLFPSTLTKSPLSVPTTLTQNPLLVSTTFTQSPGSVPTTLTQSPGSVHKTLTQSPGSVHKTLTQSPRSESTTFTQSPLSIPPTLIQSPMSVPTNHSPSPDAVTVNLTQVAEAILSDFIHGPELVLTNLSPISDSVVEQHTQTQNPVLSNLNQVPNSQLRSTIIPDCASDPIRTPDPGNKNLTLASYAALPSPTLAHYQIQDLSPGPDPILSPSSSRPGLSQLTPDPCLDPAVQVGLASSLVLSQSFELISPSPLDAQAGDSSHSGSQSSILGPRGPSSAPAPVLTFPTPVPSSPSCPAIDIEYESSLAVSQRPRGTLSTSSPLSLPSPPLLSSPPARSSISHPAPSLHLDPLTALHQSNRVGSSSGHASSLSPSSRTSQSPPKQTLFSPCVDFFEPGPPSWEDGEDRQGEEEGDEEDIGADESQYRHRRLTGDSGIEVCRCRVEEEDEEGEEEIKEVDRRRIGGNPDLHDSVDCPARDQVTTGEGLCNPTPTTTPTSEDGGKVVMVMETA